MAAFRHLLSPARRQCFSNPPPPGQLSHLLRRVFSSEPEPSPTSEHRPESGPNVRNPVRIQPVSYPVKPKPAPSSESHPSAQSVSGDELQHTRQDSYQQQGQQPSELENRPWTRDEMRYMKDAPSIAPVSYPTRVAPLPEDRARLEEQKGTENEDLNKERRRIDDEKWAAMRQRGLLRYGKKEEQDENLPFPQIIKVKNADDNNQKKVKVVYDLREAIRLIKAGKKAKFVETLEAHVKMTPELRRTDLKLTGFVRLPHVFGKTHKVAVFAEGPTALDAQDAGADVVGGLELVENILAGKIKVDFDKCFATHAMMEHVKKLPRYLKQLMPDPKKGTVTNDLSKPIKDAKQPSVLFKKDKTAIVHVGLGKLDFSDDALRENIGAFVNALLLAKPTGLKKSSKFAGYVESFHICSTMGQSYPVTIQSLSMAADYYNKLHQQQ